MMIHFFMRINDLNKMKNNNKFFLHVNLLLYIYKKWQKAQNEHFAHFVPFVPSVLKIRLVVQPPLPHYAARCDPTRNLMD
jgi:hypothetical protein